MKPLMRAKAKAGKRFVEIAYCCYIYGVMRDTEAPIPFEIFCKKIEEIHQEGKKEWKNL